MLIECPRCHARATLPEEKEGSKVRCGECGRVFLAYSPLHKGARTQTVPTWVFVVGLTLGGAFLVFLFVRSKRAPRAPVAAATEHEGPASLEKKEDLALDWSSPPVQTAVRIHEAAFARDENALRSLLHAARIHEREEAAAATENGTARAFAELTDSERLDAFQRWTEDLTRGEGRELVAEWRPFDGEVVDLTDTEATVRLAATPRDGSTIEKRTLEWKLAKERGAWKAWSWTRFLSPQEQFGEQRRVESKAIQKVELSDGSVVFERDPEPLEHLADTPPELRARIDALCGTMTDLDLTKESSRAQAELIEIGRPALPILLTGLYQTPLDSEANAIKINLIDQALRTITGFDTGFKPQLQEGSGVGTTEERQKSSVRQWFAWWYKNQKTFVKAEQEDALEGLIELTEEEKRWLERHKD